MHTHIINSLGFRSYIHINAAGAGDVRPLYSNIGRHQWEKYNIKS